MYDVCQNPPYKKILVCGSLFSFWNYPHLTLAVFQKHVSVKVREASVKVSVKG